MPVSISLLASNVQPINEGCFCYEVAPTEQDYSSTSFNSLLTQFQGIANKVGYVLEFTQLIVMGNDDSIPFFLRAMIFSINLAPLFFIRGYPPDMGVNIHPPSPDKTNHGYAQIVSQFQPQVSGSGLGDNYGDITSGYLE